METNVLGVALILAISNGAGASRWAVLVQFSRGWVSKVQVGAFWCRARCVGLESPSKRYDARKVSHLLYDLSRITTPTVGLAQAAAVLGIGRSTAYHLARSGEFPCKTLRVGTRYRVVTADLRRLLSIEDSAA
ncbi:helix-turn-helix domain-containing protein [Nocardia sp. NPDC020380]|uniref:helix-turn-helix domain-containing protein n=1 Tax=Nocardia sp. NPDC020380 TaxID=3364309 RepID=UPI0037885334